jgi:hypothetical protein
MGPKPDRRTVRWAAGVALGFGLWVGAASTGSAEPAGEPESSGRATAERPGATRQTPGTVELDEVEIRGEIEKPKLFFILPKAQREAQTRERRLRFYPDILEPLDKDRFEEEARVLYQHGIPAE